MKVHQNIALLLIIILIILIPNIIVAQNPPPLPVVGVLYTYDFNGNRIMRESTLVYVKRGLDEDSTQVGATITAESKITVAPYFSSGRDWDVV